MGANREILQRMLDGTATDDDVRGLVERKESDPHRFDDYLELLQERVPWKDEILLRLSEHLFIVASSATGERIVKCDCGQEYGDYRVNWKLNASIFVRRDRAAMEEVFTAGVVPDPSVFEIREFYCPGCAAQLAVEVVPPGYPLIFEMLPDLDELYGEWLGRPLRDASLEWYSDLTCETTRAWLQEGE